MKQVSQWRVYMIVAVTLVSLILVLPTARYLIALSSDASEEVLDELREKAIALGLDLQGGVDVTLTIDRKKSRTNAIRAQVATLKNTFRSQQISAEAYESQDGQAIVVRLQDPEDARRVANELSNSDQLEGIPSEAELATQEPVRIEMSDSAIERNMVKNIDGALLIVRERLDKLGLTQPSIAKQGSDRIRVQVPGEKDPTRVIKNLTTLAEMEFRLTHPDFGSSLDPIIGMLDELGELKPGAEPPLGYEILPYRFGSVNKTTREIEYTEGMILIERETNLTGENLRSASVTQVPMDLENPIKVSIQFDREGTKLFGEMTIASVKNKRDGGPGDHMAIVLDGVVRSAPTLGVVITGGSAVIEGGFTFDEATDLANVLKAGSLPAPLIVESQKSVGATLGNEAILSGVKALMIGTLLVVVFMIWYYRIAGVIAIIALIMNVLIIFAALSLSNATLTLAGIGGILLTIGMAVDANVLIYERIREEIDAGRPLRQAMQVGFDRAFTVILDSNLTTLMTALVLLQFVSEGSVFGFALTMTFGILANLYTGLTVTMTLCTLWFKYRDTLSLGKLRFFHKPTYDFVKMGKVTFPVAMVVAVIGVTIFAGNNLLPEGSRIIRYGVDFEGGLVIDARFAEPTTDTALRQILGDAGLAGGERIQKVVGNENDFIIRVRRLENLDEEIVSNIGVLKETETRLRAALDAAYPGGVTILSSESFGPETGSEFRTMAGWVIFWASIAILIYLGLRFEVVFGAAAVITLIHDLSLTVLLASLWNVEITLNVVAGLLLLLGYSVNDTIVIFDRIRENTRRKAAPTFSEICNLSINQSLSRTIITSGTAVLAIVVMLFVGGEGLRPLAKVLLIGSIVGTYSSSFIATPIVHWWNKRQKGKILDSLGTTPSTGPDKAKAPESRGSGGSSDEPKKRPTGGANVPKRRAV